MNRLTLFLFFALLFSSCSGSSNQDYDEYETEESFEDGTYCAYVEYYNPNTGTNSTYTLEVEVESNQVTRIYWSNGGWLDEDHFYPEDLDSDGTCTFTSDNGYEYTVTIIGQDCLNLDSKDQYRSQSLPKYTFEQATRLLNMSQEEIDECDIFEEEELLSENDLIFLKKYLKELRIYLKEMRGFDEDYKSVEDIKRDQKKMQQEINEGYIISKKTHTIGEIKNTTVKIRKKGIVYLLEVQGNSECTMGTARFDENKTGWQIVYIKQYPDRDELNGHYMRIIDREFE